MDEKPNQWPYILEPVLFPHRVSHHSSAKYSTFYLMYNREPVVPVDLKYGLNSEPVDLFEIFNGDMFEAVPSTEKAMRDEIQEAASRNIKKVQANKNVTLTTDTYPPKRLILGAKRYFKKQEK